MKGIFFVAALTAAIAVSAAEVNIDKTAMGSGAPGQTFSNVGVENAKPVNHSPSVLHAPQYLPFYPTAAVIWPRVIEVPCIKAADGALQCEEYHWSPSMGRAEYLFFTPVVKEPAPSAVVREVVKETVVVPGPERIILKEVPVKPKKE